MKKILTLASFILIFLTGCQTTDVVTIYSNSDEEAIEVMKKTLDENGYQGKYEFQTFGSGDLMAKMQIEQTDTNADIVMLSTFYLNTLDQLNGDIFTNVSTDDTNVLKDYQTEKFYPSLAITSTIFFDEQTLKDNNLPAPKSYKDLANPIYKDMISIPDINGSTTAWLMTQSTVDNYSPEEAQSIIDGIIANAGTQLEPSGAAPIKKVQMKEAAIGVGLRHQVQNLEGITQIVPEEGNYSLSESYAVVNNDKKDLSNEIIDVLATNASEPLQEIYPIKLRQTDQIKEIPTDKTFSQPLDENLLKEHKKLWGIDE